MTTAVQMGRDALGRPHGINRIVAHAVALAGL